MKLIRRISLSPQELGICYGSPNDCPDIWELDTGDFVVIGIDATEELRINLPPDVGIGQNEKAVVVPRKTLLSAKQNIPRI